MPTTLAEDLRGVMETLLITLYIRATESQRPDALIHDEKAVEVFRRIGAEGLYDFGRMESLHLSEENRLVIVLRNREIDRGAREYLARRADVVAVHIGCGLDTRFQRVDDGRVEWYDLDLPDVIDLRRRLIGAEGERHHLLGASVVEDEWLEAVDRHRRRAFLFLAEGVFMYLAKSQVKRLLFTLSKRFPGAELVCDAYSPIHVWRHNLQYGFAKIRFPVRWGIQDGKEMEAWDCGLRLLGEWSYFDEPTPRLNRIRWMRGLESVVKTFRVYRFRLGDPAE